jgi:hypothetical protein
MYLWLGHLNPYRISVPLSVISKIKKYFSGLLVLVYLVTVTGVPVYNHYCGGELEEVSLLLKSNDCCGEEEEDAGCCSNEDLYIRNAQDFVSAPAKFKVVPAFVLLATQPAVHVTEMNVPAAPLQTLAGISDSPALQHDLVTVSVMRI